MRNIHKNIITKWKPSNKISDLIQELPNLCNNYEYQIKKHLLPDLGEYYINSYKYDINDFLRNPQNKCFKILAPNSDKKNINEKFDFYNKYLIVTSTNFIILTPIDEKYKNICKIEYVRELFDIETIEQFFKFDLNCLKIIWNKNDRHHIDKTLCGHNQKTVINNIYNFLLKRKGTLLHTFKFIQKINSTDVSIYEEIIKIKEKLIENKINDIIFNEISTLYQKIIEILTSKNEDEYLRYIEKFHKFIEAYDKLKKNKE